MFLCFSSCYTTFLTSFCLVSPFLQLKCWLHKLVPSTATVTEGRIKHRIKTLLTTCASLSPEDCQSLLADVHDFHTLAEPLAALGLNRLHLLDACQYHGLPLMNISNHVVIELENFRSQNREPSTFVNKWLNILCTPCNSLTPKQLKSRVEKVVKKNKDLSKRKDITGLEALHESFFLDNSMPRKLTCKDCDTLSDVVKSKDHLIKELQKENDISNMQVQELKLKSGVLEEELKASINVQSKVLTLTSEQRSCKKENLKLKSQNQKLEKEIEELKDKSKSYKYNTVLRKENSNLENKVVILQDEIEKLKEKTSFSNLSDLKRKVENEQAQKSKWKAKFQKLDKSLVVDEPRDCDSDLDDTSLTNLREALNNKFTSNVRLTYMALQGEADVPASKCSKVVDIVSKHLHGKTLKGLPCVSSILNMADEGHHIAKQQIADRMLSSKHITFSSDGTSRQKQHFMERHVILDDGSVLSLGFTEIAFDDAKSMLEQAVDILEELSEVHCSTTTLDEEEGKSYSEKIDEGLIEILKRIKSLMSDRASNMKAFDRLFYEYKTEKLGPDDASTIFLFCNAHFLLGLSAGTEKVLKGLEEEISEHGTSFGGPPLFFHEQATLGLIRCAADILGPRGDEKNGCRSEWLVYCKKENIVSKFCSYRNNRFNNLFDNASALCLHRKHILNFIENFVSNHNQKIQSVHDALQNKQIVASALAVALLNKLLTGPYWNLMNSSQPYSSFPQYVHQMDIALQTWSSLTVPDECLSLQPAFTCTQVSNITSTNNTLIDFNLLLMSDDYCRDTFSMTFTSVVKEMHIVMKRQLSEFLEGGIFSGDIPDDVKTILDKCPLTNLTGERLFGDFDYDISKRRHSSTHHRSTINMWKHNQTAAWLRQKNDKERERILMTAQKFGKILRKQHNEAVEREQLKIQKKLEETEKKKNEKEVLNLKNRSKILDAILKKGFCNTEEELHEFWINSTLEDLKNQIRYRKMFLNQKNLKTTGNKKQLYEMLRQCIIENPQPDIS